MAMFERPEAATDDDEKHARSVLHRLSIFESGPMQTSAAARELAKMEPETAARVLAVLIALARAGGREDALVIEALGRAVLAPPDDVLGTDHRELILDAALAQDLQEVAGLFIAPAARLGSDPLRRPRVDPTIAQMTLGHKKMLARKANPELLARLAAEGEPSVVRNILLNPRLTESQVVRICARRPIRPEVFREVWANRRWSSREMVRGAIVQNPYCEPELALKVLPTLSEATVTMIARNRTLHASIRNAAERLRRKPAPEAVE